MTTLVLEKTVTAKEAKNRLGEVIDESIAHPVGISRNGRLVSVLVSERLYQQMQARLEALEDADWLRRAREARAGGFASATEVAAIIGRLEENADAKPHE
ncbi:type II toxin-antitoxin system Phd/YefM family antitoxin [Cupriavidus sp. D39]|uniref:type II toxin-antitoxin system Phd/YefM family antitoxin n=1 Tax=Cupriavidus sp. D39 TaxID=2997877 RepID=UPI00226DF568|nr:type II toxin-antitoxin system Phd/YefM family antitoxin [Cupriavidus sp. D39]MCY0858779.1 type II toxin-antitoxin system Phd/YefM family antitoxin [Cupriavidus sp. D39]